MNQQEQPTPTIKPCAQPAQEKLSLVACKKEVYEAKGETDLAAESLKQEDSRETSDKPKFIALPIRNVFKKELCL